VKKRAAIVAAALLLIGLQFFQPDEPIPTLPGDGAVKEIESASGASGLQGEGRE